MSINSVVVDTDQVAKEWNELGFSCELWEDVPGHEWADCVHETDELFVVVEGSVEIEMGGGTLRPQVGHEVYIPAGTQHTVRNVGDATSRWLHGEWMDFAQTD